MLAAVDEEALQVLKYRRLSLGPVALDHGLNVCTVLDLQRDVFEVGAREDHSVHHGFLEVCLAPDNREDAQDDVREERNDLILDVDGSIAALHQVGVLSLDGLE